MTALRLGDIAAIALSAAATWGFAEIVVARVHTAIAGYRPQNRVELVRSAALVFVMSLFVLGAGYITAFRLVAAFGVS
jgi:hypothetical protein